MKKIMIFAALAAALTLSSCSKEESRNDVTGELRTVNFTTSTSNTKTIFGDKVSNNYPILWQAGDKVCPSLNFSSPTDATDIPITPVNGGTGASFSGEFPDAATYQFFFVSPAAAFKTLSKADNYIGVEFPGGQTPTATSPDPVAQVLFANTGELTEIPNPVNLTFKHLSAYLHLNIINVNLGGATVQAVNITNEASPIAGRFRYYLDTDAFTAYSPVNTIAITTSSLTDIWCGLAPVDLSSGELTIVVSTDQGTFTKVVHMPASAKLTPGKIAKFTVDMDGVAIVSPVVYTAVTSASQLNYGDKVIIATADPDLAYAMSTSQNTNNRAAAGVTKTADELTNPTDAVEIFKLEEGIIPGHYAFKTTIGTGDNDGYLYAANPEASGSNLLKTKAAVDNSASWDISIGDVTVSETTWENAAIIFADIPSTGRGLIRFNKDDKLYSAYLSTSSQQAVKIYRLTGAASPHFNATLPNGSDITAAAQEVKVYVYGNVAWTAAATGEGASLDVTSGTGNAILTLTVPANTSTESTKAYSVTVSTTAEVATKSYTLDLTQAKKINASGDPVKVYDFFLASAGNNLGSNGSYAGNCDVEIGGITWNVTGVSNSTSYAGWRLGGNNFSNINRTIYSKTALPNEVTKIVVSHSRYNITINSFTLTVHSSASDAANGANPIATLTTTVNKGTQDVPVTCTFQKADATSWAGCYYRLAYNVTNTLSGSSNNKYVEFRGLEIWGYVAD